MSNFVCYVREGLEEETRKKWSEACKKLDFHDEYEGKRYCVLHFPSGDKDLPTFEEAIKKKLKDNNFDFRGVYFPGNQSLAALLPNLTFEGRVDFSGATFEGRQISLGLPSKKVQSSPGPPSRRG